MGSIRLQKSFDHVSANALCVDRPKKKTARESAVDYDKICVILDIRQGTDCEECYVAYNGMLQNRLYLRYES